MSNRALQEDLSTMFDSLKALLGLSKWEPPRPQCEFIVACARSPMPAFWDLVNMDGPFRGRATPVGNSEEPERQRLERPMRPGDMCYVESQEGAGFRIEVQEAPPPAVRNTELPDPQSQGAMKLTPPLRSRWEEAACRVALGLLNPSGSPPRDVVYGTRMADRLADLAEGTVFDLIAERFFASGSWQVESRISPFDCRDHVVIHRVDEGHDEWVHTHGLLKFGRPEVEVYGVPSELADRTGVWFLDLAQYIVDGALIRPSETMGDPATPLFARVSRKHAKDHWHGRPALELVDLLNGKPGNSATRGLRAALDYQAQ